MKPSTMARIALVILALGAVIWTAMNVPVGTLIGLGLITVACFGLVILFETARGFYD